MKRRECFVCLKIHILPLYLQNIHLQLEHNDTEIIFNNTMLIMTHFGAGTVDLL